MLNKDEKQGIKSINQHPFILSLLQKALDFYPEDKKAKHSELIQYQKPINDLCLQISSLFDVLKLSRTFIQTRYPQRKNIDKTISNSDFFSYHLDCYFIRVTSFKDLMCKLINKVYELNHKETSRLYWQLKEEKNKDIQNLVGALDVMFESIIKTRNNVAHGGSVNDRDLGIIRAQDLLREYNRDEYQELNKRDYNALIKKAVNTYSHLINITNAVIFAFLVGIAFDVLYEERLKREKIKSK